MVEPVSLYLNITMCKLCHHQLLIVARVKPGGEGLLPVVRLIRLLSVVIVARVTPGGEGPLSVVRLISSAAAWGEGSSLVVLTFSVLFYEVKHVPASHGHMCLGFARHAIQHICHKIMQAEGLWKR